MCLVLEQYYIFLLRPEFNKIPVAGSGGVTVFTQKEIDSRISLRGEEVYLYSLNKEFLHAKYLSQRQAALAFKIPFATVNNILSKGTGDFWSTFHLSKVLHPDVLLDPLSKDDVIRKVAEAKILHFKMSPTSNPSAVNVTRQSVVATVLLTNERWFFYSKIAFNKFYALVHGNRLSLHLIDRAASSGDTIKGLHIEKLPYPDASAKYPGIVEWSPSLYETSRASLEYNAKDNSAPSVPKKGIAEKAKAIYIVDHIERKATRFNSLLAAATFYQEGTTFNYSIGGLRRAFRNSISQQAMINNSKCQAVPALLFESQFVVDSEVYYFPDDMVIPIIK